MSLKYSEEKVLARAGQMGLAELLDRVTVYRPHMEPSAVDIFEAELARRGLGPDEIRAHDLQLRHRVLRGSKGLPATCSYCRRAAVETRLGWYRLWGLVPLFKRRYYACDDHEAKLRG